MKNVLHLCKCNVQGGAEYSSDIIYDGGAIDCIPNLVGENLSVVLERIGQFVCGLGIQMITTNEFEPSNEFGKNGDIHIREQEESIDLYQKLNGEWTLVGSFPIGGGGGGVGDFVTINTDQFGLTGTKEWQGRHYFENALAIPREAPTDPLPGKAYIYAGPGTSAIPPETFGNLEDLQNVASPIPVNKFLYKGPDGIWVGVDVPGQDLSAYAPKVWVSDNFYSKEISDGLFVTQATDQFDMPGNKCWTGRHHFDGSLAIPQAAPVAPDPTKAYIFVGAGSGATPPSGSGNLEDLQNVDDIIANNKFLYKGSDGIWVGADMPIPSQNLYLGSNSGQFGLTGGNSVQLSSLSRTSITTGISNLESWDPGFHPYSYTTGASGFPASTGAGFMNKRSAGTFQGSFLIDKTNANDGLLRYAVGSSSGLGDFEIFASHEYIHSLGIGTQLSASKEVADLNNLPGNSMFVVVRATALNRPWDYGTVLSLPTNAGYSEGVQIGFPNQSNSTARSLSWRGQTVGNWHAWRTVWDDLNHNHRTDAQNDARYIQELSLGVPAGQIMLNSGGGSVLLTSLGRSGVSGVFDTWANQLTGFRPFSYSGAVSGLSVTSPTGIYHKRSSGSSKSTGSFGLYVGDDASDKLFYVFGDSTTAGTHDSRTVASEQWAAKTLLEGAMVERYRDPSFQFGENNIAPYPSATGTNITRMADSTSPTGMAIRYVATGWAQANVRITFADLRTQNGPSKAFIVKMIAKIPVGWMIQDNHNGVSSIKSTEWVTENLGTGQWEEYIFKIVFEASVTSTTVNFFDLRKANSSTPNPSSANPVVSFLAFATVIDTTESFINTRLRIPTTPPEYPLPGDVWVL